MFQYLGEEKQDQSVVVEKVNMPNVVGLSVVEAVQILIKLGLEYELDGFGTIVTTQLPPVGTELNKGDCVVLVL